MTKQEIDILAKKIKECCNFMSREIKVNNQDSVNLINTLIKE